LDEGGDNDEKSVGSGIENSEEDRENQEKEDAKENYEGF